MFIHSWCATENIEQLFVLQMKTFSDEFRQILLSSNILGEMFLGAIYRLICLYPRVISKALCFYYDDYYCLELKFVGFRA